MERHDSLNLIGLRPEPGFAIRNVALAALAAFAVAGNSHAQITAAAAERSYPAKLIHLISPYPPGGSSDTLGRLVGQKLTEAWGQPVIVENRAGAAGTIGSDYVAKAPPDGYTILLTSSSTHAVGPALGGKLPYDPLRDFAAVTQVASAYQILVVQPSLPAGSVRELIALAKSKPGQLSFASNGNGTPSHIAGELFKTMAKVEMLHVPYKGGGPMAIAMLSGEVSLTFGSLIGMLPHVRTGKLKALAVTAIKRQAAVPDLPTLSESGLAGYEVNNWYGVLAPAATPQEIVATLNTAIVKIMHLPEVRERLSKEGLEPAGTTPAEFASYIKAEIGKWSQVVKASGARAD
jgi:tripartite-type tricarboxylate transporter receptor subunit TctC